ncbi:hypothetical protein L6164_032277 [Bauhinia variegata]|uniref:Uncharacterized protein n=1 Tax=Bauhinia variegata TaxID=167791 RepID=A0ACB9KNF5_BAUVA|nr:hypothetical protein L6164_032277 [Bauhinia variegata]
MSHQQQQSHIPKFGNWDTENVPYTAYFENARRERTGLMINPNDPQQNPELLKTLSRGGGSHKTDHPDIVNASSSSNSHQRSGSTSLHRSRGSHGSFTPECVASDSRSDRKRSMSKGTSFIGSFSSSTPSHHKHRNGSHYHSSNDNTVSSIPILVKGFCLYPFGYVVSSMFIVMGFLQNNSKTAAIPKFGAWDETDPGSGDGFTRIFNQIEKEKQIDSGDYPNDSVESRHVHATSSNIDNQYGRPTSRNRIYKYCCCLFSSSNK